MTCMRVQELSYREMYQSNRLICDRHTVLLLLLIVRVSSRFNVFEVSHSNH